MGRGMQSRTVSAKAVGDAGQLTNQWTNTATKEIPGAELRIFEASGHVPHLEESEAVAAAVTEFCARGERAR